LPFRSKAQLRAFAAKERAGELPKGTFQKWKEHTRNIKDLPEKVAAAYDMGVKQALADAGLAEEDPKETTQPAQSGKETRLKLDHKPHDFYGVRRAFERADVRKKEIGTHVPQKP
jgi:hypothetical protein